jgi:nitroreductase
LVWVLANDLAMPQPMHPAEFLRARRSASLKLLTPPAPNDAELERILTLASRTPDHGRLVPYRFIVLDRPACVALGGLVRRLYQHDHPDALQEALDQIHDRFANTPLLIAVVSSVRPDHPKVPEWEQVLTAGAVCMNALHAAHALGYAGVWLSGWTAFDWRVLSAIGLTDAERLAGWLHLGTMPQPQGDRPRPDLSQIVTRLDPASLGRAAAGA